MGDGVVRVLVTGGAGFLGSHVVDELVRMGCKVAVLDALVLQVHRSGTWPAWLPDPSAVPRHLVDVRDREGVVGVLEGFRPHCVVHLAAEVGVGQAEVEIERYVDNNVRGTAVLLESILAANGTVTDQMDGVRRLVVAGSMSSYGEGFWECLDHGPVRAQRVGEDLVQGRWTPRCPHADCTRELAQITTPEWASLRPAGVYAATKRDQEELSLLVGGARGLSVAACRFFNLYGPRQAPGNPYTGVVVGFGARVRQGLAPRVYEDGGQVRDLTHVTDAARAVGTLVGSWQLAAAMRMWQQAEFVGPFNVGTGKPTTILDVAKIACWVVNPEIAPEVTGQFRVGDVRACIAGLKRLTDLGWAPLVGTSEGLGQLYAEMVSDPVTVGDLDAAHAQVVDAGLLVSPPDPDEDGSEEPPATPTWG